MGWVGGQRGGEGRGGEGGEGERRVKTLVGKDKCKYRMFSPKGSGPELLIRGTKTILGSPYFDTYSFAVSRKGEGSDRRLQLQPTTEVPSQKMVVGCQGFVE